MMTTLAAQAQMTEIEQTPRCAIEQWQKKEINGTALMRRLIAWKHWNIAIFESAAVEMLATNAASCIMYGRDPKGVGWIFRLSLEGISEIVIDPFSPTEIVYGEEHFAWLWEMADAMEVEEALTKLRFQPESADDVIPLVRDYASYVLAVNRVRGGTVLAMAPDARGRQLAAVFTSMEAFDAFYPEGKQGCPDGELLILNMSGIELFSHLAKMNLEGMVFNCSGPARPIAFAAGIAQVILDSVPQSEQTAV